jgi:3-oxoacyl-[acyl-carrier-protein] synthase II
MKNEKVFITGLGSISAIGYGSQDAWSNLLRGESGLKVKSDWNNTKIKPHFYGETPSVQFEDEIKWMDRFPPAKYSQLGILAFKNAIDDAGIVLKDLDNEIGLIIETSLGATESVESYLYDLFQFGVEKISPIKFTKTVANTVLGDVSRLFKINGPSSLLYNENSICYGADLIRKGVADIIICGGVDHYTDYRVLSEQETNHLIRENDHSSLHHIIEKQNQIDQNLLGDGASFIVLESETSVRNRKAKVYSELVDYDSSFDFENVETTTIRTPYLLDKAFKNFNSVIPSSSTVAFVSAFTTQSQIEHNEQTVIDQLNSNHQTFTIQHKPFTGDMKAASGVMGVSVACQVLKNQKLPQLLNPASNQDIDFAFINTVHEGGGNSYFLLKQCNN